MGELVYCEFLKLKRTKIKIIAFLGICSPPILSMFSSIRSYIFNPEYRISLFTLYDNAFMFLLLLFGPLIFVIFQTVNLGLSLLGGYVHSLRLTYVEYFGKFYDGGGRAFKPFKSNSKYINLRRN